MRYMARPLPELPSYELSECRVSLYKVSRAMMFVLPERELTRTRSHQDDKHAPILLCDGSFNGTMDDMYV
jgi:hypothetical protein